MREAQKLNYFISKYCKSGRKLKKRRLLVREKGKQKTSFGFQGHLTVTTTSVVGFYSKCMKTKFFSIYVGGNGIVMKDTCFLHIYVFVVKPNRIAMLLSII